MKIISESTDEYPFQVGMDIWIAPPYPKQYSEQDHREATINLFGQLLGGDDGRRIAEGH